MSYKQILTTNDIGAGTNQIAAGNHNHDSKYVKKSGDTMTGMLQFSGIPTGNFTEGIRINKATDGWTSICLGGSASSGCSAETWSMHTQQDGASANFWLTHNGSNVSNDNTGSLCGHTNGVWTLSNSLQIVNYNTNINGGSSQVTVTKGDNAAGGLTLYYNRDGNRGLWDNITQKSLVYLDPNNIATSNFRWHFTGQDNSLHNLNGNYQANLSDRPFASALEIRENGFVGNSQSDIGYAPSIGFHWGGRCAGTLCLRNDAVLQWYNQAGLGTFQAGAVWGAVWNDYAEFRKAESIEPGRCVIEHSSAEMKLSTERLQPGAEIISDTFGFAIGETDECKTPIASSGRVLAYPYEDRNSYPLGAAVCSGPNGTISLMTREEIKEYPERIIGTVSEIPDYEEWVTGKVKVNGRIWIRIR